MTEAKLKLLRIAIAAYIIVAGTLWCFYFDEMLTLNKNSPNDMTCAVDVANTIYYIAILLLAFIIVIRARLNLGNLLFALLITGNGFSPIIPVAFDGLAYKIIGMINYFMFYLLLLKTFQYFPKPVTREDILHKIRWKPIRRFILLAHHDKSWLILLLVAFGLMFTRFQEVMFVVLLLILITYLYINLSKTKSDRNKVLWLFWGTDIYFACLILNMLFYNFSDDGAQFITGILNIIQVAALLFAMMMSFFFFDSFDTGVIVKRTIINSFMLISIIFVYNVIEHYFLHWVSHQLHLSDALVSSVLSGILVMFFSPIHHKLMHFFEKKLKTEKAH